jgi:protein subunit release factor B
MSGQQAWKGSRGLEAGPRAVTLRNSITLRIGAGRGPFEARRFVAMLAEALCERLLAGGVPVHGVERHGDPEAPGRVALRLEGTDVEAGMAVRLGTHMLTAELRGPRARRRWFAAVELDRGEAMPELVLPAHELDTRFVRSRGPGGQNVNKRSTAVQITHVPTGIAVHCDTHRSQARNRAAALEGLGRAVARHLHEHDRAARRTEAWEARRELPTHHPVMRWRLHPTQAGVIVPE